MRYMAKREEKNKEENMKKLKTTEILDYCGTERDLSLNTDWDKKHAYESELEKREPFDHIKKKLERQQEEIKQLKEMVEELTRHTHDAHLGKVVTPIKAERIW